MVDISGGRGQVRHSWEPIVVNYRDTYGDSSSLFLPAPFITEHLTQTYKRSM